MRTQLIKKKLFFASILIFICSGSFAQTVEVKEASARILGERHPGFRVKLEGDADDVEKFLKSKFRDAGKLRDRNTYFQISEVTLGNEYYGERIFYAQLNRTDELQTVWVGVDTTSLGESGWSTLSSKLKQYTYDLGIEFYRSLVQVEIDESEKAEKYIERQQKRLERDSVNLKSSLASNEEELIRLYEAIENNKKRHEELLQEIKNNKVDIDSNRISLKNIQKVIEEKKKKKERIK